MFVTLDDDATKRQLEGILAIQIEGVNMRVLARDIRLKTNWRRAPLRRRLTNV